MPLPIDNTLGIFNDNIARRRSVLPIPVKKHTAWANGLDIPKGGEVILYTGQMYQLIPYIKILAGIMSKFEESWLNRFFGVGRFFNRFLNVSKLMAMPSAAERDKYDNSLRNIALLLRSASVDFGYLYEDDLYAGALAYDEGLDEVFRKHARFVADSMKGHGVKRIITVDPHTTDMLRSVYPRVLDDFDIEVQSYLEVLATHMSGGCLPKAVSRVALHDSCVYARYEGIIEEPRKLLKCAGYTIDEAGDSGRMTHCCGGPIESLFPEKANQIATDRVGQLSSKWWPVVTMCPICLVNLQGAAGEDGPIFKDIADVLADAFLNEKERESVL